MLTHPPALRRRLRHQFLTAGVLLAGASLVGPLPAPAYSAPAAEYSLFAPVIYNGTPGPLQIVFHTNRDGNYEIYRMLSDGTLPVRLTTDDAFDQAPAFSGGQASIAFQSDRDGDNEIYRMNTDGGGVTPLTFNDRNDLGPAWSPQTGQIAFASNRDSDFDYEIFVMDAEGGNQVQLTHNNSADSQPRWSPDGTQIVYNAAGTITVMDADGSNVMPLTSGTDPDWSPNGSQLAYTCFYTNSEICLIASGGGSPIRLTTNNSTDINPVWHPNGQRLAFLSNIDHPQFEVYTMSPEVGAAFIRLTNNGSAEGSADW